MDVCNICNLSVKVLLQSLRASVVLNVDHFLVVIAHDGTEVCNNYNSLRGCVRSAYSFARICNSCFLNHTVFICNKTSSSAHPKNNSDKRMSAVSEEKK